MGEPIDLEQQSENVVVVRKADVAKAQESARRVARQAGFSEQECEEIVLVVSELGSNLIKHAGGGKIQMSPIGPEDHRGIQVQCEDSGPGIANVELAMTDGYSTAKGLGTGLGTVNRLMDRLEFEARPNAGLRILCQRWVRPSTGAFVLRRLEFGAATRSYRLLPENGDAIVLRQWADFALAGVIDGLGHGPFAQRASQAARQYLEQHFDQPLEHLFRGVGRVCRGTRGVVMALARFDLQQQTVKLANVGNVEVRLVGAGCINIMARRGVIGLNAPSPHIVEHAWTPASVLILHSDGLRSRWQPDEVPQLQDARPAVLAKTLLEKLGKFDDDATVVVIKNCL